MKSEIKQRDIESIDSALKASLRASKRVPAENPWFRRRVMAALPEKKSRGKVRLEYAMYLVAILLVLGGWIGGGVWFLNNDLSLTSLGVICCIPLTTLFSGAVVATPVLRRLFR
ncbi:MAG: hypothetical protein NC210_04500 [[Clostridium] fimetarium]|nr:hypothetical protein [Alistipes timonensis]MCM1405664.1 hypothetical protein [[Clostridium] fimetarium]